MWIVGDESKSNGKVPWVTFSLIAINIVVYCAQCFLGDSFTRGFSLVPKEIKTLTDLTKPEIVRAKVPARIWYENGKEKIQFREVVITVPQAPGPYPIFLTLLTSMFMHGGWLHLLGNMWFLAVFGRNVECALDHGRFLAFYIFCGVIGGLVYTASDSASVLPCLGASGAIAGVMGAYVAIHPLNPISIWFPCYVGCIQLPALIVIGAWFLFQYLAAFRLLEYAGTILGGVAYWDHLGGFVAGIATIRVMVFYLKLQQAKKGRAEEESSFKEVEQEPVDPLDISLPRVAIAKPMDHDEDEHEPAIDPFLTCLPPTTAVKSLDKVEKSTAIKSAEKLR